MVNGLEKEKLEKQLKYNEIFKEEIEAGNSVTFTGMYKYVDSGLTNKFNLPIYKRKRIFRKIVEEKKYITAEQMEEIETAFVLFDKDHSNTIDINELKDAMRSLGVHMTKLAVEELMKRVDKDGSGQLEKGEFTALMSEIMQKRNAKEEMRKVFRYYDNDDDGSITAENIWQAADILELEDELTELSVQKMLEMGDVRKRGSVNE